MKNCSDKFIMKGNYDFYLFKSSKFNCLNLKFQYFKIHKNETNKKKKLLFFCDKLELRKRSNSSFEIFALTNAFNVFQYNGATVGPSEFASSRLSPTLLIRSTNIANKKIIMLAFSFPSFIFLLLNKKLNYNKLFF